MSNIMREGSSRTEAVFVSTSATRPVPAVTADSAPYWAATREGRIDVQRCLQCGACRFYPRVLCPACWSDRAEWLPTSGRGEIHSYTIVHRAPSAGFSQATPYAVALVDLDAGVRIVGEIICNDLEAVQIGQRVEAVFERLDETITLPHFVLTPEAEDD